MALDCLDTLVGLTNRECPCFEDDRPEGFNTSDSGYFLTDREFGFPLKEALLASADCGEDGIWAMMEEAMSQAIRDIKMDLPATMASRYSNRIKGYNGILGKADFSSTHVSIRDIAGIQLQPKKVKYGKFVLTAIYLGVDTTTDITVNITSNDPDWTPLNEVISATGGRFVKHTLSAPVEFSLYSVFVEELFYNFSYSTASATPLNNKIWCCSGIPFKQNANMRGFQTDSLDDTDKAGDGHGYGLALEGHFTCEKLDWICELDELNGYELKDVIARCIQFKGAVKLISMVIESGNVNYYTLLDPEGLYKRRSKLSKMYNDYLEWITQNLPDNFSDCWVCNNKNAIQASSILT
ncbi:hypothetical protein KC887_08655 [Candidatus Kaiserbacteria bacterium]|nr:hypothetical protein [Candidatus Kaiserbacteria bacterium]